MKVLIVHPTFWIDGGAERVIVRSANWLTDNSHEVTILTQGILPEIRQQFTETRFILSESFAQMSADFQLIANDFDVINLHNTPTQLIPYTRKLNTVWMCNEPPNFDGEKCDISDKEIQMVKNHVKKVVVADEFNQKRFKEIFDMESTINPYGIDYDFFAEGMPNRIKEKYHLQNNFVITQVAFIHETKNQLRTIEIFAKVKKKIPNAKLILAGQPTKYKELVEKRMIERGVKDDVIFTDKIPREEVRDLYHASDVIIQPCKAQGSWLSVFEAMSAGKPVIVSKEMTASSILTKEIIGFVAETNEEFVYFILEIKEGKVDSIIDIKEGKDKKWVKDNLKWETFCKKMLEVFNE